ARPFMSNFCVVPPAGTATVAGIPATCGALVLRSMITPFEGAGPLSVSVPVDSPPTNTLAGERTNWPVSTGRFCTARFKATLCPPKEAVMVVAPAAMAVATTVAVVWPVATETVAVKEGGDVGGEDARSEGTVRLALLRVRTIMLFGGAGALSVMVMVV